MNRLSLHGMLFYGLWLSMSTARGDLTVGAAISVSDAVAEISAAYTRQSGTKVLHAFAGTNVVARQIGEGAPIDVFISADSQTMDQLVSENLVRIASVRPIAANRLVVVVPASGGFVPENAAGLRRIPRIAIADPQSVPAGIYAKQWLKAESQWEAVQPATVPLQNVRAALLAVATGNAGAAIVYRTDAFSSELVKTAFEAPEEKTGIIIYPAAAVAASKHPRAAADYLTFLTSGVAQEILVKHGFSPP